MFASLRAARLSVFVRAWGGFAWSGLRFAALPPVVVLVGAVSE